MPLSPPASRFRGRRSSPSASSTAPARSKAIPMTNRSLSAKKSQMSCIAPQFGGRCRGRAASLEPMAEHRTFELRHVYREVPDLGLCDVRAPSGAVERVLSQYYADERADPAA